jgi:hypothetical protein
MEISPTTLALIASLSALAGVVVTSFFNLLTARITQRAEERRHNRDLIIKAAIENWKYRTDMVHKQTGRLRLYPLDTYILHMLKFSELCLDKNVDASNVQVKLKELEELTGKVTAYYDQKSVEP